MRVNVLRSLSVSDKIDAFKVKGNISKGVLPQHLKEIRQSHAPRCLSVGDNMACLKRKKYQSRDNATNKPDRHLFLVL